MGRLAVADDAARTLWGLDIAIWVAIIGAIALLVNGVLQNVFARRREDRIRKEADDRAQREADRVFQDRESQRRRDEEAALRHRREQLSDAWRGKRYDAYRELIAVAGRISERYDDGFHTIYMDQGVVRDAGPDGVPGTLSTPAEQTRQLPGPPPIIPPTPPQ